jgi:hypothetical protein
MSVPRNFRKRTEIPKHIYLHYVNEIPQSEIETRQGYRITTPLRTLVDVIQEGTTQQEQVKRAIIDLAIQKSLIKGFATIQEIEQLQECIESQEMRELIARSIDEVWTQTNAQLKDFGSMVEPYTIGLHIVGHGFGTAVLCKYRTTYFLLTAAHVAKSFSKAKSVQLILRFDSNKREYPHKSTKDFAVIEWDPTFDPVKLDDVIGNKCRDLAIIIPSKEIVDILKNYKDFYKTQEKPQSFSLQDAFISCGGIEPIYFDEGKTCQLHFGPYAFVASKYEQMSDVDYIICPVSNHTYEIRNLRRKVITNFEGLSGSGLWTFVNNTPILIGIAIAQDPSGYAPTTGLRNVYFHGPHSILSALSILGQINEHYS